MIGVVRQEMIGIVRQEMIGVVQEGLDSEGTFAHNVITRGGRLAL